MLKQLPKETQTDLFKTSLDRIIKPNHPLCQLGDSIDWQKFDNEFSVFYCENNGRPSIPTRIMVGLHYLKMTYNESDESVVRKFQENPYWQYFCGLSFFQHEAPCDPTSLVRWRQRVGETGIEKLLEETINCGINKKIISRYDVSRVNVDTTVQEKAITFPTDAKLYYRAIQGIVKLAKKYKIQLRQSYIRVGKKALQAQSRLGHTRKPKKAKREVKRLKCFLGRLLRDFERKVNIENIDILEINKFIDLVKRLLQQERNSKNKIYSLHASEVECIAKGKVHKKYEFGCKASYITSNKNNFIFGALAFHGNPYDAHTLKKALDQSIRLLPDNFNIKNVYVDKGYRGIIETIKTSFDICVNICGTSRKKECRSKKKRLRRRSAIEPVIGHMKHDGGYHRNYLRGEIGDKNYAILQAVGFNTRKLLKIFSWLRIIWYKINNNYLTT